MKISKIFDENSIILFAYILENKIYFDSLSLDNINKNSKARQYACLSLEQNVIHVEVQRRATIRPLLQTRRIQTTAFERLSSIQISLMRFVQSIAITRSRKPNFMLLLCFVIELIFLTRLYVI